MSRISLAFRCFFALLFHGDLSPELMKDLGVGKIPSARTPVTPAPKAAEIGPKPSDGALQLLGILQRDGRMLDFFMEDIGPYSDDQVGAAARSMHAPAREALNRYVVVSPVIDGVEGTFAKAPSKDPAIVKFLGNVPANPPDGGILRHRGWRAVKVNLPPIGPKQDVSVIAPAEIEVE